MSRTLASNTLPLSYTCSTRMPYSNGLMPILVRSTACDAVTLVPWVTTFTSAINSTAPLTILVGMLRVWKKFVEAERIVHLHVLAQRRADHRVLAHQNGRLTAEG